MSGTWSGTYYTGDDSAETVKGGSDSENISGNGGNDKLYGNAGYDTIYGGDGNDTLSGGADNDTLIGGAGSDTISGGEGDDILAGYLQYQGDSGLAVDKLDGGSGNDTLYVFDPSVAGSAATGGSGLDYLQLSSVFGKTQNVTLTLTAAGSYVMVDGEKGLFVSSIEKLDYFGRDGIDRIVSGDEDDRLLGYGGNDHLEGRGGNDELEGGAGSDTLLGGDGDDELAAAYASYGADAGAVDVLDGGNGDDRLIMFDLSVAGSKAVGGAGTDTLVLTSYGTAAVWLTLGNSPFYAKVNGVNGLYVSGIEHLEYRGGDGGDTVTGGILEDNINGGGGNDVLSGQAGDDVLYGGDGDDELFGNDGDDVLVGGWNASGKDVLDGGNGNDSLEFRTVASSGSKALGGAGTDVAALYVDYSTVGPISFTLKSSGSFATIGGQNGLYVKDIEILNYYGGGDADTVTAGDADDILSGGNGDDILRGVGGDDEIDGGSGSDTIDGGDGNDELEGGDGADAIMGGGGDDRIGGGSLYFGDTSPAADIMDGGDGNDVIITYSANAPGSKAIGGADTDLLVIRPNYGGSEAMSFSLTPAGSYVTVGGTKGLYVSGIEVLQFTGEDSDDAVAGGAMDDTLEGEYGNDTLKGLDGADILDGGSGNDKLFGGNDNDLLLGGSGMADVDTLDGGAGNDELRMGNAAVAGAQALGGADTDSLSVGSAASTGTLTFALTAAGSYFVSGTSTKGLYVKGVEQLEFSGNGASDSITGGALDDVLKGNGGDDTLKGLAGDDDLNGGGGKDILEGGDGSDRLVAGYDVLAADQLDGGAGDDTLEAGNPAVAGARAVGGDGSDALKVSAYYSTAAPKINFTLTQAGSYFTVDGHRGLYVKEVEQLDYTGGTGVDTIAGGNFADRLSGNAGNDILKGLGGSDLIDGGDGDDQIDGGAGDDELQGGSTGRDILLGGAGDDKLSGSYDAVADTLDGGDGDDKFNVVTMDIAGGKVIGGAGEDTLTVSTRYKVDITTATSFTLSSTGSGTFLVGGKSGLAVSGIERLVYSGYSGAETINGGKLNDTLTGNGGNDVLSGGGGNDMLSGGTDSDRLYGGDGDDYLSGGGDGDDQNETVGRGDRLSFDILDGGNGNDTLKTESGSIAGGKIIGGLGLDKAIIDSHLETASQRLTLTAAGSYLTTGGKNTLFVEGIERIEFRGGAAADTITGGALDDVLSGNDGNDVLNGRSGDDFLSSGKGKVNVDGGTGFDTLSVDLFAATDNFDIRMGSNISFGQWGSAKNIEKFSDVMLGSGKDVFYAGDNGSELISGGSGDDKLNGGKGDDELMGGLGADIINGGGGQDYLYADDGRGSDIGDYFDVNDAVKIIEVAESGKNDVVHGGDGDDCIYGGMGADLLYGDAGDDRVSYQVHTYGTGTIDTKIDRFDGGAGTDVFACDMMSAYDYDNPLKTFEVILGATTRLKVDGRTLVEGVNFEALDLWLPINSIYSKGKEYRTTVVGGSGEDTIWTLSSNDNIKTLGGNDSVEAGSGSDTIDTGDGNDVVNFDFGGVDNIKTGSGNDSIGFDWSVVIGSVEGGFMAGSETDTFIVDAGSGYDHVSIQEYSGVDENGRQTISGFDGKYVTLNGHRVGTILNYESLYYHGSNAGTTFTGTDHSDTIYMEDGNDKVFAGGGDDFVSGGRGNDTLDGGTGNDTFDYTNNYSTGGAPPDVVITLKGATTTSVLESGVATDTIRNFENVYGGDGRDTITGDSGGNVLDGRLGNDVLRGMGGDDFLSGTEDYYFRDVNAEGIYIAGDRIRDDDILDGGSGIDTVSFYFMPDGTFVNGLSEGTRDGFLIDEDGNNFYGQDLSAWKGFDGKGIYDERWVIDLAKGKATFTDGRFTVTDKLISIENVIGSGGDNIITGSNGANRLDGLFGNDTISGGGGDDKIFGGLGNDILTGGTGHDVFGFDFALDGKKNLDLIKDFNVADDTIWLDKHIFTGLGNVGGLAPAAYYIGTRAHDASDRIIYDKTTGKLWYDADGSGGTSRIQFAQLDTGLALTYKDFEIIA